MILFKPEHAAPILAGTKTQTRRMGKRRWKVGSVHKCYTRPPFAKGGAEPFASVEIIGVRPEHLRDITMADAIAEGYTGPGTFLRAFYDINRMASDADPLVWVVEFELVTP